MTAKDAAAEITGITDEQLTALQNGGWNDDSTNTPGWRRALKVEGGGWVFQWIGPVYFFSSSEWKADSQGKNTWWNTFEEALAWCDERTRGGVPEAAPEDTTTKQETLFAWKTSAAGLYGG